MDCRLRCSHTARCLRAKRRIGFAQRAGRAKPRYLATGAQPCWSSILTSTNSFFSAALRLFVSCYELFQSARSSFCGLPKRPTLRRRRARGRSRALAQHTLVRLFQSLHAGGTGCLSDGICRSSSSDLLCDEGQFFALNFETVCAGGMWL